MGLTRPKTNRYAGYVLAVTVASLVGFGIAQQRKPNSTYDTQNNPPKWGLENHSSFRITPTDEAIQIVVAGNPITGFWTDQGFRFTARTFDGILLDSEPGASYLSSARLGGGVTATIEPEPNEVLTVETSSLTYAESTISNLALPGTFKLDYRRGDGRESSTLHLEAPSGRIDFDALRRASSDNLRSFNIAGIVTFSFAASEPATLTVNGESKPATRTTTLDGTAQRMQYSRETRQLTLSGPVDMRSAQKTTPVDDPDGARTFSARSQVGDTIVQLNENFDIVEVRSAEGTARLREDPPRP